MIGSSLTVFEAVGDDTKRERLYLRRGRLRRRAISQHTRKLADLGDPAAILFLFDLDVELHGYPVCLSYYGSGLRYGWVIRRSKHKQRRQLGRSGSASARESLTRTGR